jgi:hypothetical protein
LKDGATDVIVAATCPLSPPTVGSDCNSEGLDCTWGDSVLAACRTARHCAAGKWAPVNWGTCPGPASSCPAAPPAGYTTVCSSDGGGPNLNKGCAFPTGHECVCSSMMCSGACQFFDPPIWICSQPPAAPCPAVIPNAGTRCEATGAQSCGYAGGACGLRAACEGSPPTIKWSRVLVCPV